MNRNEGLHSKTEGEAEPFGSPDSRVQQASVLLVGSLALAPLRDGLYQCQRVL